MQSEMEDNMTQISPETDLDDMFFNGDWIRRANPLETTMEAYHQSSDFRMWYQLDLTSKDPLDPEQVRITLDHLYRKVPSLNVCFGSLGEETWLRRATNPRVDFQVFYDLSLETVRDFLRNYYYDSSTGPLFCVRLLYDALPDREGPTIHFTPLPYRCHIFFGFHHGLTDGTSSMLIISFFMKLLNEVIADIPINDFEELGTFVPDDETRKLIHEKKRILRGNPAKKKLVAEDFVCNQEIEPLLFRAFPDSIGRRGTTSLVKVFSQSETSHLMERCRLEEVSLTSTISAIMNAVVVKAVTSGRLVKTQKWQKEDFYIVKHLHVLNIRDYWYSKSSKPLGLHTLFPLPVQSPTPKDTNYNYWDHAREIEETLLVNASSGKYLFDIAFLELSSKTTGNEEEYQDCDYIFSSMGSVTSMLPEGGNYVKIINIVRGSSLGGFPCAMIVNIHVYKGALTFSIDYNREKIPEYFAKRMFDDAMGCIYEEPGMGFKDTLVIDMKSLNKRILEKL